MAPTRSPSRPGAALAAVGEVLGIYVSGQLVAFAVLNQQLGDLMLPIGLLLLVGAVGLEWRDKRRKPAAA